MEVKLVKEQVREIFGKLVYIGSEPIYTYDKQEKNKTDNVEAIRLHLGSSKQGKSIDVRMKSTEEVQIEAFTEVELEDLIYAPYVKQGEYVTLVERFLCQSVQGIGQRKIG